MRRSAVRPLVSLAAVAALAALAPLAGCAPAASSGASPAAAGAPSADGEVRGAVARLFDAMRAGDSAAVRAAFHPRALLASALVRDGRPETRIEALDDFVRAVGTPHADVWDERLHDVRVSVDGPLAAVWADYEFYAGARFSHCGVDAFQLARTADGWRIVALTDTRRRGAECPGAPRAR